MSFPLQLGDRATFARVRALFERVGFREDRICRGLGIQNISQVGKAAPDGIDFTHALGSEVLGVLARLFVFTQTVPREAIEQALNPPDLAAAGFDSLRATREVLPGVTTMLEVRLRSLLAVRQEQPPITAPQQPVVAPQKKKFPVLWVAAGAVAAGAAALLLGGKGSNPTTGGITVTFPNP